MKRARILFVDDEKVFANNMSKLLNSRGYNVTTVFSGDEAIRALEEKSYDVVVLDLKMPGMDGITTLKEIKKLGLFTETLILTGHGAIDSALEATKLGAYDYLTKPCEIDELVTKIEGAWEKKDDDERKDLEETIQRVTESPKDALKLVAGKKKKLQRG
jgi:DNA-binding NtrC family response regulator